MYILIYVSMNYQSGERGHEIEGEWGSMEEFGKRERKEEMFE